MVEGHGAAGAPDLVPAPAGIMYSAFGAKYIAEAVESARSSLRRNHVPHLLFAAEEPEEVPDGLTVVRFEQISSDPFVDRIANMRRSPFERTIYLDSDTYLIDDITDVFAVLDRYEMALSHANYRGLQDPEVPRAFSEFNCGVVAWRAGERTSTFLQSWEETYRTWLGHDVLPGQMGAANPSRSPIGDQPAFRRCAWEHAMKICVLPPEYNLRLGYRTTVVDRVHLIHGRFGDYERLAERMNRKIVPRTFPTPRPMRRLRQQRRRAWRVLRERVGVGGPRKAR
ncbi:MAG TPA: hypothetical protein VFW29_07565 [Solirubrobacteraceae bacterium]|nr:hypothetical protein [Solirubrobacteraceae bacterium]